MSQTMLNNTPKQYVQNGTRVNNNSPLGSSASSSYALVEASNNQNNGVLYFRTVLDSTECRLEGMSEECLQFQSSVHDLPPETNELYVQLWVKQLLLRIKLIQFHDLINKYEKSLADETEKPVTFSDPQGFMDMVLIQAENADIRFDKLKKLKYNNWTEEMETANLRGKHPVTRGSKK